MENSKSRVSKSDEEIIYWSLSDDQWSSSSSSSHVKPFNCAFCSKGFSTAQGLGGHMNIHRKDRALLRQQNLLSLQVPKSPNPPLKTRFDPFELLEEEGTCNPKSPNSLSIQDGNITCATKHSPFGFGTNTTTKPNFQNKEDDDDDEDGEFQPSSRSIQTELDLELRLGLEPNEISSTRNAREFI